MLYPGALYNEIEGGDSGKEEKRVALRLPKQAGSSCQLRCAFPLGPDAHFIPRRRPISGQGGNGAVAAVGMARSGRYDVFSILSARTL